MAIKNAYRHRAKKKFASAGLQTLYSELVKSGFIYCVQQVAWEIDTATANGNTRVRLFIEGHGYRHNIEEQGTPAAGTLYTYDTPLWLIPGERLAIDIDQAQANTIAEMCLTGYWTEFKEGIT